MDTLRHCFWNNCRDFILKSSFTHPPLGEAQHWERLVLSPMPREYPLGFGLRYLKIFDNLKRDNLHLKNPAEAIHLFVSQLPTIPMKQTQSNLYLSSGSWQNTRFPDAVPCAFITGGAHQAGPRRGPEEEDSS